MREGRGGGATACGPRAEELESLSCMANEQEGHIARLGMASREGRITCLLCSLDPAFAVATISPTPQSPPALLSPAAQPPLTAALAFVDGAVSHAAVAGGRGAGGGIGGHASSGQMGTAAAALRP